jgi:hypothetical protein
MLRLGSRVQMHPLFQMQSNKIEFLKNLKSIVWTSSQPICQPSCFTKKQLFVWARKKQNSELK